MLFVFHLLRSTFASFQKLKTETFMLKQESSVPEVTNRVTVWAVPLLVSRLQSSGFIKRLPAVVHQRPGGPELWTISSIVSPAVWHWINTKRCCLQGGFNGGSMWGPMKILGWHQNQKKCYHDVVKWGFKNFCPYIMLFPKEKSNARL